MRKQVLTIVLMYAMVCSINAFAQPSYELRVINEAVVGTNLEFDIYILRTGPTPIYLGDSDFKLNFNTQNFSSPEALLVSSGLSSWYTITTATIILHPIGPKLAFVINIKPPLFSDQSEFDTRVMNVSNSDNGSFVGRFRITNISSISGTVGLIWRYLPAANTTVITSLSPLEPWNGSDITSASSEAYFNSDAILPVQKEAIDKPTQYLLESNFPNPFNPTTTISYQIPTSSQLILKVYNILGCEIATLVNETKPAGTYKAIWDASLYPSGIYFYRFQANAYIDTKKMMLVK
jgi:hypothetical protein